MDWIKNNKTIRVTSKSMTRFLFTLDDAVDAVLGALNNAVGGEVFVPQINSYTLPTCIKAMEVLMDKKATTEIMGLRPGEKLHEDMLAQTELDFTYEINTKLLTVLPQYTNKTHTYNNKYRGLEFNSSLHNNNNIKELITIIKKGLDDAN